MKTLNKIVLVVCILIIMYYIYQSGYQAGYRDMFFALIGRV